MNLLDSFDSRNAGRLVGRSIARIEKKLTGEEAARNLKILGLLALPWAAFMIAALRRNPRQMWAQRWPTIVFVGLYEIALDRCVRIEGIENLPKSGPVILAGNHINKTAMDGMLLGSKILRMRGGLSKFVSIADPDSWMLRHFVRLMGESEGVVLPIQKGMTTETMIQFLENPAAFHREQSILGIFPVGEADRDFEKHMQKEWHTSAAVAAYATGAPIVPFFVEGLPYAWGPLDILKAIATGAGPARAILALGYAGWAPGQLENEIQHNGWLHCTADAELIFGTEIETKYDRALKKIGVTPGMLSSEVGHA